MRTGRHSLALASVAILAACSTLFPPPRTPAGPFEGVTGSPGGQQEGGHRYRVSLEARCVRCSVTYWFGPEATTRQAGDAGWHDVIYRTPLMRESVRLQVRAAESGRRSLSSISISVDGEVVARGECDDMEWEQVCVLTVETVIGPPEAPLEL